MSIKNKSSTAIPKKPHKKYKYYSYSRLLLIHKAQQVTSRQLDSPATITQYTDTSPYCSTDSTIVAFSDESVLLWGGNTKKSEINQ